ncbi:MAG TPA: cell division protein ZipA [Dongiaceae bacterium]|nr:cell division protein ZipA [Dongiaceae bacterium]
MEIGLREVLILLGVLVVAGILADGYRRMRRARLVIKLEKVEPTTSGGENQWDMYRSELPNGGARVVQFGQPNSDGDSEDRIQGDSGYVEPFGSAEELDVAEPERLGAAYSRDGGNGQERKRTPEGDALSQSDLFADDDVLLAARAEQQARLSKATRGKGRPLAPETAPAPREHEREHEREQAVSEKPAGVTAADLQEVLVMNVMARQGELPGGDLLRVLLSCGFRFGEMNIFHRYEQHSGKGAMLFSVANVVEPGTFDLDNMDNFSTPGICMFMQLPGPKRPMHAFEIMMDSARKIANLLEADIRDEQHNILRQQTAEHYRQRVLDFERKLLTLQGGQRQY